MIRKNSLLQNPAVIAVLFFVLALLAYGHALGNAFIDFDDGSLIYENALVQDTSLHSFARAFVSYDPELYTPLTTLTYKLNYQLGGLDPFGYHLGNLLLHTINALLVTWLIALLARRRTVGVIAGLLFLVHPIHTEAVAWAAARRDVLSAAFFLGSLISYVLFRKKSTSDKRLAMSGYTWSLVFFFLGLLSKVVVVTLPLVLFLIDWYQGRRIDRASLKEKIPFLLLCIPFVAIAIYGKISRISFTAFLWEKVLLTCKAILFYIQTLFFPYGLSALYPYTEPISLWSPNIFFAVVCVLGISFATWRFRFKTTLPLFLWGFALLTLLPSLAGLTREHNAVVDFYFASDRYAYLPSIAFFFAVALGIAWVCSRYKTIGAAVFAITVVVFAAVSSVQATTWRTTESVFANVIEHYPQSHVAYIKIGEARTTRDDLSGALKAYNTSIQLRPSAIAYYYIALLMLQDGQTDEAIRALQQGIAASPIDTPSYVLLANLYMQQGGEEEARAMLADLFAQEKSLREGKEEARELWNALQNH